MRKGQEFNDSRQTDVSPLARASRTATKRKAAAKKPEKVEPTPEVPKVKQTTRRALHAKATPVRPNVPSPPKPKRVPRAAKKPKSPELKEVPIQLEQQQLEDKLDKPDKPAKPARTTRAARSSAKVTKITKTSVAENLSRRLSIKAKIPRKLAKASTLTSKRLSVRPVDVSPIASPEHVDQDLEEDHLQVDEPAPTDFDKTQIDNPKEEQEEPVTSEQLLDDKPIEPGTIMTDFSKFSITRTIGQSDDLKSITFLGEYHGETAVLRLEKTVLNEDAIREALKHEKLEADIDFVNDVYHSYMLGPPPSIRSLSDLKTTFICPANESVINKYTEAEQVFVSETPDVYSRVVEPYIDKLLCNQSDLNNWVYNILDGKAEQDRLVLSDPDPESGFVLSKNIKSTNDEDDLYLLAICNRRDIRSLRDLSDKHLVLLKNILTKGNKAVKDKFKKFKGQLRIFVHYQPSFYHFHVHFKAVNPASYHSTDRDHLLSTIISNLTINKDYYKKSTITYPLSRTSALHQELKKAKKV